MLIAARVLRATVNRGPSHVIRLASLNIFRGAACGIESMLIQLISQTRRAEREYKVSEDGCCSWQMTLSSRSHCPHAETHHFSLKMNLKKDYAKGECQRDTRDIQVATTNIVKTDEDI